MSILGRYQLRPGPARLDFTRLGSARWQSQVSNQLFGRIPFPTLPLERGAQRRRLSSGTVEGGRRRCCGRTTTRVRMRKKKVHPRLHSRESCNDFCVASFHRSLPIYSLGRFRFFFLAKSSPLTVRRSLGGRRRFSPPSG